jgi:hypothetical protein
LGERLLCKQEVIGSIPFTSTTAGVEPEERGISGRGGPRLDARLDDRAKRTGLPAGFELLAHGSLTG